MEHRAYSRRFFRIRPENPLFGTISIVRIGARRVFSNAARVRILDISPGGLRFVSSLKLPVDSSVILEAALVLGGLEYCLRGCIVHVIGSEVNEYEYGLKFPEPDPELRETLKKIFSRISVRQNRHIIVFKLN
ncbi:MAG TPA: PilZ domain-containing protein [Clostridia bacterium]|nr:PilZ domain-containing protein [Clostridia bacterium]